MPTDTSNTQSFRINRLKCKVIAESRSGTHRISNQQTAPHTLLVEAHQGQTDARILNAIGASIVDAGCCGSQCNGSCVSIIAQCISGDLYTFLVSNFATQGVFLEPLPVGYLYNAVVVANSPVCDITYNISSILEGPTLVSFDTNNVYVYKNIDIEPGRKGNVIVIFLTQNVTTVGSIITINGTIQPCGLPLVNTMP